MKYAYHITLLENLPSIQNLGLIPGYKDKVNHLFDK